MYHLNALFGFPLGLWGAFMILVFLVGAPKSEPVSETAGWIFFLFGFIPLLVGFLLSKKWFDVRRNFKSQFGNDNNVATNATFSGKIKSIPCPIPLGANQQCILALRASRMISKEVNLGYAQEHEGITLKMKNGPKYSYGSSARVPITENETKAIRGNFVLTNKNIVFASMEKGFSYSLAKITNIQTFENDCLMIQKDSTHYFLMFDEPCAKEINSLILNQISQNAR